MSVVFPITPDSRIRTSLAVGGETTFSVPFPFQDNQDIAVSKIDVNDVVHSLAEGVDYSLTGAGNPSGGTVTLMIAAIAGEQYIRKGSALIERVTSVVQAGKFASGPMDSELDRNIIILQEFARDLAVSLRRRDDDSTDPSIGNLLPLPVNGFALVFGPDGELVAQDLGETVSVPADALTKSGNLFGLTSKIAALDNLGSNGTDIASAATLDLDDATGDELQLTGSVAISAVTLAAGRTRWLRATATVTLQVGALLAGNGNGSNVVLAAGDMVRFRGYAGGLVRFLVLRASGKALTAPAFSEITGTPTTIAGYGITDAPYPPGHLYGCTIANNASDAVNDIDFAAGKARDSTDVANMVLAALTKRLDASWAAGTNQGGRMSAAAIADGTYHCYVIKNPTSGAVDAGFDTSATAPTLPNGYTLFRRVGSIVRASGTILAFIQDGDEFAYNTGSPPTDYSALTTRAKAALTLTLPSGIRVKAKLQVTVTSSGGTSAILNIYDGANTSMVVSPTFGSSTASTVGVGSEIVEQKTNTLGQVQLAVPNTVNAMALNTLGWTDVRGRT